MTARLLLQGPARRVHYRRVIRGTQDAWVHCGRPLHAVRSTRRLALVTCRTCACYIAKGLAAGYLESRRTQEDTDATD